MKVISKTVQRKKFLRIKIAPLFPSLDLVGADIKIIEMNRGDKKDQNRNPLDQITVNHRYDTQS